MYNFSLRENNNVKKNLGKSKPNNHLVSSMSLSKAPSEERWQRRGRGLTVLDDKTTAVRDETHA